MFLLTMSASAASTWGVGQVGELVQHDPGVVLAS